jgi:prepilin-type N-terminal cleavage/methylation domain-containing protein
MKTRRSQRTAMTLIEVLLVVALMAILAGLAIPNANPSILEQLRSSAGIVAADLAYARSESVTYGSDFRVTFSVKDGAYDIEHVGANGALDDVLRNPFDDESASAGRYHVILAELPNLGPQVRLAGVSTIDADGEPQSRVSDVTFGPLGETTRSQDTRIWLAVGSGSSGNTITVHVNSVTGLATVESPGEYAMPDVLEAEPEVVTGP